MTDLDLLKEVDSRFCEDGAVPFPPDYSPLIEALSFTASTIESGRLRQAWTNFLDATGCVDFIMPIHLGFAIWYWGQGMLQHAASVFEHLHRSVRRGNDQPGEIDTQQSDYLPDMIGLYEEIGDRARVMELFGRVEELHEDGYVNIEAYSDALIAALRLPDSKYTVKIFGGI